MAEQEFPRYKLLKDFYGPDDTLHPEDTVITYTDTPNEYMQPLNDAARDKMDDFLAMLDAHARVVAEKAGRTYTGRTGDLGDQIQQAFIDARKERRENPQHFEAVSARDIPQRPDLVPAGKRRGRPSKLLGVEAPEAQGKPEPKPITIMGKGYENDVAGNSTL